LLVHLAALSQVCGYLMRDQLALRVLLLIGTTLYAAYYVLYPDRPLWDAIFWSVVMGASNLWVIRAIVHDRRTHDMTEQEERLFRAFHKLTPGEFRRLMQKATFRVALKETILTEEGSFPDRLFFVMEGTVLIKKGSRAFTYMPGTFIGELSMLTEQPASATVSLPAGGRYVTWDRAELNTLLSKSPSIRLALESLLNRDMAAKLAVA
jgi:CRP-like cAMP-binding protein